MFELVSSTDVHSDSAPALRLLCTLLADVESARQQVGLVPGTDLSLGNGNAEPSLDYLVGKSQQFIGDS